MVVIYVCVAGMLLFVVSTAAFGVWLRTNRSAANAERSSRVMHFLFFVMTVPLGVAMLYPGITRLDAIVGLSPLPLRPLLLPLGIVLGVLGANFLRRSNAFLRRIGNGANAFRLTRTVVDADVYRETRNPMSLGYYMVCLAVGLVAGSTAFTLGILFGLVPAHLFFLLFFERLELELRFGEPYLRYRQHTPFLFPRLRRTSA